MDTHQYYCDCVVKEYNRILMTGLPEQQANLHDVPSLSLIAIAYTILPPLLFPPKDT